MNKPVNTLEYARMLEQAGMERAHAEAVANLQARVVGELVENELVTKNDLKVELQAQELRLRDEIRSESTKLRDEIRSESTKLREEMRNLALAQERRGDTMMLQIRAVQFGGAIAAFAIGAIVLLTRLIR